MACRDRALVLESLRIPHRVVHDQSGCALIVPAESSFEAVRELALYDEENPPPVVVPKKVIPEYDALPGIFGYVVVISLFAWLDSRNMFGLDWRTLGRVDGELIRGGEWWRLITALTLHSGVPHLVGNLLFGTFFGLFVGRLLGPGVSWFAIVVTAACGNLLNTLLLESTHRSIGASTAVFAALGLVAGYVWRSQLMSQERWSYRVGPIVGGLALLAYTGTGNENTDVGAHLMGFVSGFAGGMLLTRYSQYYKSSRVQWTFGGGAIILLAIAWISGLFGSNPAPIM